MQMQQPMTAREFAERILSGIHVVPAATPTLDATRRELKQCEWCPRLFTRVIGAHDKYCSHCHPGRKPVPVLRWSRHQHRASAGREDRDAGRKALARARMSALFASATRVGMASRQS